MCFCTLKDEEINQQSQLAEKLKQQMLDQEEVSTGRSTYDRAEVFVFLRGVGRHDTRAVKASKPSFYFSYLSHVLFLRIIMNNYFKMLSSAHYKHHYKKLRIK